MPHEKVFVICENKCFEEGMTKVQIETHLNAIKEEASTGTIDPVTKKKYQYRYLTRSEYDALSGAYEKDTVYIITDDVVPVIEDKKYYEHNIDASANDGVDGSLICKVKFKIITNSAEPFTVATLNTHLKKYGEQGLTASGWYKGSYSTFYWVYGVKEGTMATALNIFEFNANNQSISSNTINGITITDTVVEIL